jgi:hypothetical protein
MAEASGFFVLLAGLGAAWITAYFNFRATQEADKRAASTEEREYRREQKKERDRLIRGPIEQDIAQLEAFLRAIQNHFFVHDLHFGDEEKEDAAMAEVVKLSGIVYRSDQMKKALLKYRHGLHTEEEFLSLVEVVELELDYARSKLNRTLLDNYERSEPRKPIKSDAGQNGPIVKAALWLETRLRKWLP